MMQILLACIVAFVVGLLLGWNSQRRMLIEIGKTNLAVLSEVADILDRIASILDKMVEDLPSQLTDEEKKDILEFLNGILLPTVEESSKGNESGEEDD